MEVSFRFIGLITCFPVTESGSDTFDLICLKHFFRSTAVAYFFFKLFPLHMRNLFCVTNSYKYHGRIAGSRTGGKSDESGSVLKKNSSYSATLIYATNKIDTIACPRSLVKFLYYTHYIKNRQDFSDIQ